MLYNEKMVKFPVTKCINKTKRNPQRLEYKHNYTNRSRKKKIQEIDKVVANRILQ